MAAGFIAAGAKVYISSRKADQCEETAAELGPNCIALADGRVHASRAARRLPQRSAEREPKLDILVNNAGAAWGEAV